ncbi:hypothetical protein OAF65_05975, partial [Verrucomicrobiales bacterium]|nr:hypothetical protein [Verrucomicrobiales bacterium]
MNYKKSYELLKHLLKEKRCKICNAESLHVYEHVAKCKRCGVLLNFPYLFPREEDFLVRLKLDEAAREKRQTTSMDWHVKSGHLNHENFTHMTLFAAS